MAEIVYTIMATGALALLFLLTSTVGITIQYFVTNPLQIKPDKEGM